MRGRVVLLLFLLVLVSLPSRGQMLEVIQKKERSDELERLRLSLQGGTETLVSRSVPLAIALSLVLPGAGEWYAGNWSTGKYFMIADGALWLTYAGFVFRGDWLREDARSFARIHAGVTSDRSGQYEVDLGNYSSVQQHNEARLRSREYHRVYSDPNDSWRWDTEANRLRFRATRIRSDEMYQNAKFAIGVLVANRLISAFSAGRAAARTREARAGITPWRMEATVSGGLFDAHGIEMKVSREF